MKLAVKKDATSRASRRIEFLIDSSAIHSVVPRSELRALGIKPFKKTSFILADGGSIEREVGTAHFVYKGFEGGAPVIFGEGADKPLLGATTLEALELGLNPLSRELIPLPMTLMGAATLWDRGPAGSVSLRRRRSSSVGA